MTYGNYSTPGASSSHNPPASSSIATQGINPVRQTQNRLNLSDTQKTQAQTALTSMSDTDKQDILSAQMSTLNDTQKYQRKLLRTRNSNQNRLNLSSTQKTQAQTALTSMSDTDKKDILSAQPSTLNDTQKYQRHLLQTRNNSQNRFNLSDTQKTQAKTALTSMSDTDQQDILSAQHSTLNDTLTYQRKLLQARNRLNLSDTQKTQAQTALRSMSDTDKQNILSAQMSTLNDTQTYQRKLLQARNSSKNRLNLSDTQKTQAQTALTSMSDTDKQDILSAQHSTLNDTQKYQRKLLKIQNSKAKKNAGNQQRHQRHHPYAKAASRSQASGSQIGTSDASTSYQSGSFSASLPPASVSDHHSSGVPSQSSNPFFSQQTASYSPFYSQTQPDAFPPHRAAGTSSDGALSFPHSASAFAQGQYPYQPFSFQQPQYAPQPPFPDFSQTTSPTMGIFGQGQEGVYPQQSQTDFTQNNSMQLLQLQQQAQHDPMSHLPHLILAVRTSLDELQSTLNINDIWLINNETHNHFGEGTAFASMSPQDQISRIQAYSDTFNTMAGTKPFSSDLSNACDINETQRGQFDVIQVLHHYTFGTTDTSQTQPVTPQ